MKIAILGAGGHGRVVLDILLQAGSAHSNTFSYQAGSVRLPTATHRADSAFQAGSAPETRSSQHAASSQQTRSAHHAASAHPPAAADIVGFLDSNPEIHGRRVDGLPVLGGIDDLPRLRAENALDALIIAIGDNGIRRGYARQVARLGIELISAVHPSASIAQNAHIGRNTVVTAGVVICAHCQIGDSVILNTGCIIDHQSMIGEGAHICPGVRIAGRVKIEPGAFVGIGATILPKVTIGYESIVGAGAVVTEDVPDMATVVGVPAKQIKRSTADEETAAMLLPARL